MNELLPRGVPAPRRLRRDVPRGTVIAGVLVLLSVLLGIGAVLWPAPTIGTTVGVLVVATMLVRLDWAVLVVVVAAPFLAHPALVDGRLTALLVVVLTGSWVVDRSRGERGAGHSPGRLLVAVLILVAVLALSMILHDNGAAGQRVLVAWLVVLTAAVVLVEAMRSVIDPVTVVRAYVLGAAASSVLGVIGLGMSGVGSDAVQGWLVTDGFDLDLWAFHLLVAVPMALALRYVSRRKHWCDLGLVVVVLGLVSTTSWGTMVGLVAMLVAAAGGRMISLRVATTVAVLVATAVTVVHVALPVGFGVDLGAEDGRHSHSWAERRAAWDTASGMVRDSPLLGLGPGSFTLLQQDFRGSSDDATDGSPVEQDAADDAAFAYPLEDAHSTYFAVAAQLGFLGLALLLILVLGALTAMWRRYRLDGNAIAAGTAVCLVGAVVVGVVVEVQLSLSLWLLVALAAVLSRPPAEPSLPASLVRLHREPDLDPAH